MECPKCGAGMPDGTAYCPNCGATQAPSANWSTPYYDTPTGPDPYSYAGFWRRFASYVLDLIFVLLLATIPGVVLAVIVGVLVSNGQGADQVDQDDEIALSAGVAFLLVFSLFNLAYNWIAATRGGGWGKRLLGIRIVKQEDGTLPGWRRGFLRMIFPVGLGMIPIPILEIINFMWLIFDEEKQTWHDKFAGTVVIRV